MTQDALWWEPVDEIPRATRRRPRFDENRCRIAPPVRDYGYREGRLWGYADVLRDFTDSGAERGRVTFDVERFSPTRIRSGLRVAIAEHSLPVTVVSRGEAVYIERGALVSRREVRDELRCELLAFASDQHRTTTITVPDGWDEGYAERCLRNLRRSEGVPFVRIEHKPGRFVLHKEPL